MLEASSKLVGKGPPLVQTKAAITREQRQEPAARLCSADLVGMQLAPALSNEVRLEGSHSWPFNLEDLLILVNL